MATGMKKLRAELDPNRPFASIRDPHGDIPWRFEQDSRYFDIRGLEVDRDGAPVFTLIRADEVEEGEEGHEARFCPWCLFEAKIGDTPSRTRTNLAAHIRVKHPKRYPKWKGDEG